MRSTTTARFRELLRALPADVQSQAHEAYRHFRVDPFHPSLQFKSISQRNPTVHSVRIGLHYRAIGFRERDEITWIWIGAHPEYDRMIRRL